MSNRRRHSTDFLRRAQELFEQAVDLPAGERAAFLEGACGEDAELREEALELLRHDEEGFASVAGAVQAEAAHLGKSLEDSWIGRTVGVWRITGILGKGGMGAVYEAVRDDLAQRGALKLIRRDMDSADARRRFLEERQILASLEHPDIARLLDGGSTAEGLPYLVMEAVPGTHLLKHCEQRQLGLDPRLRLAVTAIRAVQAAHQRLIVHRDLKPANIFVTPDGAVKLLDFGIAKLLTPAAGDATATATRPGHQWMTPDYASPEQLRGEPAGIASDIYSLGAVVYELVTGQKPLALSTRPTLEALRAAQEEEPRPPSSVAPEAWRRRVRGDLDTVIMKALQKEPARRYATAHDFATDLERVLSRYPVMARPDTFTYRAARFVRRNAFASAAVAVMTVGLVGAAVFSTVQARRAEKRFNQVRVLANKFLFDFHDAIKNLSGSLPARELVASTALEYLDGLSAEAQGDRALLLELGAAYEKVGDVLGDRYGPNLGKTKEALASYQKALDLRLRATGGDPETALEVTGLIRAYYKVSEGLVSAGKTAEAEGMLDRGVRLAAARGTEEDRAGGQLRQGDLALRRGDLPKAREGFLKATAFAREQYERRKDLASRRQLAQLYVRLGHAAKLSSMDDEALEAFARAIEINQEILAEAPMDVTAQRSLVSAYNNRGDTLRNPFTKRGIRSDLSLVEYRKSKEIADRLLAAEPQSFVARYEVLFADLQIADTWRELEPKRGVMELERMLDRVDALVASNPEFKDAERTRALLRLALSDACSRAGDAASAERHAGLSIAFFERVFAADPGRFQMRRELALVYGDRAILRLAGGDRAGAQRDTERCLTMANSIALAKARPVDLRDTARCHEAAGRVARESGDLVAARRHFEAAVARWRAYGERGIESGFIAGKRKEAEARLSAL